jgi:hypothetical protein
MLFVHLYFVKIFGCAIVEHEIPIDIEPFRRALQEGIAHPKVWISIGINTGLPTGRTDLELVRETRGGSAVFATWFYVVADIAVNIMYADPGQDRQGLVRAWHPSKVSKNLALARLWT